MSVLDDHLVGSLSNPDIVYLEDTVASARAKAVDGTEVLLRDLYSFDNGAPGVVAVANAFRRDVDLDAYSRFLLAQMSQVSGPSNFDKAGSLHGLVSAASVYSDRSSVWRAVQKSASTALERKLMVGIARVRSALVEASPMPSLGVCDVMRGIARDALVLANTATTSTRALTQTAHVLMELISADQRFAYPVMGAPLLDRAGEMSAHRNYGNAHGSTGIAHTLTLILETLRTEAICVPGARQRVIDFCRWGISVSREGAPPMYTELHSDSDLDGLRHEYQSRPSWCYGSVGFQLLLLAVGTQYDIEILVATARRELLASFDRVQECVDLSLCHGLAGLHAALLLGGVASDDRELLAAAKVVASMITEQFDVKNAFGFAYGPPGLQAPAHVPGVLNGAAGVWASLMLDERIGNDASVARRWILLQAPWLCLPIERG